jgi:hypothetical protein
MICNSCSFETERLTVIEWRAHATVRELNLADVVVSVLTAPVTQTLPAEWQGDYDANRAAS